MVRAAVYWLRSSFPPVAITFPSLTTMHWPDGKGLIYGDDFAVVEDEVSWLSFGRRVLTRTPLQRTPHDRIDEFTSGEAHFVSTSAA